MNGAVQQLQAHKGAQAEIEREPYPKIVAGGSRVEALGGVGALILTILGLSGIYPVDLASMRMSLLCISVSVVLSGTAIGGRRLSLLVG